MTNKLEVLQTVWVKRSNGGETLAVVREIRWDVTPPCALVSFRENDVVKGKFVPVAELTPAGASFTSQLDT